jgi:hypothetical protein
VFAWKKSGIIPQLGALKTFFVLLYLPDVFFIKAEI